MKLTLPQGQFKAYLFDCDGTITDSMPLHFVAWNKVFAEYACHFPETTFYAWGGMPVADIIERLNAEQGLKMPVAEIMKVKEEIFRELLSELQAVPEVLEHILAAHGKIPFAVVSGSPRESVVRSLEKLGILDRFETLVCAGDYKNGKPDPEPFLIAAERLGIAPADCLVFEDAELGIQAATAAGMASVKVLTPLERAAVVA
ncbi:haloacid dehalogenase superfamily, subfamily IA, variant 3 with third motif having DD or ED/beta-phosphoglucomutase family hydrolase [Granulicella rosea]|uniref:Haloacid dehalogenase superfamily, subfamily IA, variant 3 with third motif having DD or ED/beta-phosphoglucomutase family hydrolase n=1 Tax=Granulicella rosea TaxID=474952 RepID=A0A239LT11_9BACT|nr:HAD family phosphatase [Granulicella rosea]SNT32943.1 haloacid dehalogenase superfamily, subfamily IA, variant 3 with third motif having DD or ED/beta-phosphoglucomutase family hydrolase [Granulicella rosea]